MCKLTNDEFESNGSQTRCYMYGGKSYNEDKNYHKVRLTITQVSIEVLHIVNVTYYTMYILKSQYFTQNISNYNNHLLIKNLADEFKSSRLECLDENTEK